MADGDCWMIRKETGTQGNSCKKVVIILECENTLVITHVNWVTFQYISGCYDDVRWKVENRFHLAIPLR